MRYKVATYILGRVVNEFETDSEKEVKSEYSKSISTNVAVRVWDNGVKLPYIVSNSLFGQGYREINYCRDGVRPNRIIGRCFYAER